MRSSGRVAVGGSRGRRVEVAEVACSGSRPLYALAPPLRRLHPAAGDRSSGEARGACRLTQHAARGELGQGWESPGRGLHFGERLLEPHEPVERLPVAKEGGEGSRIVAAQQPRHRVDDVLDDLALGE